MTALLASLLAFATAAFAGDDLQDVDADGTDPAASASDGDGPVDTSFSGTYTLETEGAQRKAAGAFHLGMELRGIDPGVSARFDLGQRVSVEGSVFAGVPQADGFRWTGGASIGLELAPVRFQIGTKGSLDFRLGAGGVFTTKGNVQLEGPGINWAEWAAGTLQLSPNGTWSIYAGLLATDVVPAAGEGPTLQPRTGVRFKID